MRLILVLLPLLLAVLFLMLWNNSSSNVSEPSVSSTSSNSYLYLGDYKDGGKDRPRALPMQFPGLFYTPSTCYEISSKGNNYTLFALQNGGECW